MQDLISIIIPIYNVEHYLEKCIDSVLSQSYYNLEIILVDDGSPDDSGRICDRYADKDDRIIVIHKQNGGLSDARNVALNIVSGVYVTFIDSDDYVARDYIESLYLPLKKFDSEISISRFQPFLENKIPMMNLNKLHCEVYGPYVVLEKMFYQDNIDCCAWAKMYKSDLFDDIRFPKGILYEDLATTYKLLLHATRIVMITKCNYFYLLRNSSIERCKFNQLKLISAIFVISQLEREKICFDMIIKSYYSRLLNFMFHIISEMPSDAVPPPIFIELIRKYRRYVIFDRKSRLRSKIACLLSYIGSSLFFTVLHNLNKTK